MSRLLGSVGRPGCGEAATQRAHSCIPLGPPGKCGGSLLSVSAFWYSPGSGFLDSLAPGKHSHPGGTASGSVARPEL